jgi:phosphatidylglycerol:prolipoprotein diacylglycerol transferase
MDAALRFPVHLHVGPVELPLHLLLESLAYLIGFRLYLWQRQRRGDHLGERTRGWVVVAAVLGAAAGSKLVYWLSDPWLAAQRAAAGDVPFLMGGKSIAGALAGGLIAVEAAKARLGVRRATGDLFAVPLAVGIAVGRVGCFLGGLEDHTHGLPSTLPWAVDFGDGLPRHPAQLYEALFLALLVPLLLRLQRPTRPGEPVRAEGDVFKALMVAYFAFRLLLEFLKPGVPLLGLYAIQWVCLGVLLYYAQLVARRRAPGGRRLREVLAGG